jgi:hypothetical protein
LVLLDDPEAEDEAPGVDEKEKEILLLPDIVYNDTLRAELTDLEY